MLATRIRLSAVLLFSLFATAGGLLAETASPAGEVQFVQLDADSDGFITVAEWKGGPLTFANLDRDGDDILTRTEFFSREQRYRSREERFRALDADRDGRVSAREWKWGPEALAILDQNHDGFLNRKEFRCREASTGSTANATRP
jgi:EF hand domain-containing protein